MAHYSTEQKKLLYAYLSGNGHRAYTVDELIEGLRLSYGMCAPGKSTVYRLIMKLVEEGKVRRFSKGSGRQFVYQIVGCRDGEAHIHLRCISCGKFMHLDEKTSEELICRVEKACGFAVKTGETVLFGECADCKKHGGKEK